MGIFQARTLQISDAHVKHQLLVLHLPVMHSHACFRVSNMLYYVHDFAVNSDLVFLH